MPPHTLFDRPAREFAAERLLAAVAAPSPAWDPVSCRDGRVYAKRTVYRRAARLSDSALDRRDRWC